MALIEEYYKNDKRYFMVNNLYLGINPYTGKEVRKSKRNFKSRKEASIYISQMKLEFENGELFGNNRKYKFHQVYDLWLDTYKRKVKESTYAHRLYNSKKILKHFAYFDITKITRLDCQKFINGLADKNYSRNYIKDVLAVLKVILKFAVNHGIIKENPALNLELPKRDKNKMDDKYYNNSELAEFLEIAQKEWEKTMYLIFRVLAYSGARISEVLALTWEDIDFKNNTISINKTLAKGIDRKIIVQEPKTQSSIRVIELDPETIALLKELQREQKGKILQFNKQNKEIVFLNEETRTYTTSGKVTYAYKKLCKSFNLKDITIHGFRHTHTRLLFETNATVQVVQNRLGHSNFNTTMNVYNRVTEKQKEGIVDAFAEYVKNA